MSIDQMAYCHQDVKALKSDATALSIRTLSITTLSIMGLKTTLSVMTYSLLSLLIIALALLFIRLDLSKASQGSMLGLDYICINFQVLINL